MGTIKRVHTAEFKKNVVLALLKEAETIGQICSKFGIHPTQARRWREKVLAGIPGLLSDQGVNQELQEKDNLIEELYKQIGQQKVEVDWLKKRLDLPFVEKIKLIERDNDEISIRRQCELLDVNRSNYYYERKPAVSGADEVLMKKIDEIHTKCPMYGVRKITKQLHREKEAVNHKRVQRLMQILGIQAIYPGPNTSKPAIGHSIYPYLLTDMKIIQPNQVWGVDIAYIRMHKEWLYLVAIIDWYSRYVLSWELSDTMSVGFCMEALAKALHIGVPEIHNSDQGSQFTAQEYLALLQRHPTIRISMDHRGRCFDNIFTERLWRSLKYEEVYVKDYQSPREARENIGGYINFYNNERLHQSLNYQTPKEFYFVN